jgi:hypothetical protein
VSRGENLIKVPRALLEDEEKQKKLFEVLAGKMMGAGSKKGQPYTGFLNILRTRKARLAFEVSLLHYETPQGQLLWQLLQL